MSMDFILAKQLLPKPLEYDPNGLLTSTQNPEVATTLKYQLTDAPFARTYFFQIRQALTGDLTTYTNAGIYTNSCQVRGAYIRVVSNGTALAGWGYNSIHIAGKTVHNVAVSIEITTGGLFNLAIYWNGQRSTYSSTAYHFSNGIAVLAAITKGPYAVVYDRILTTQELDYLSKVYNYKNPIGGS